MLNIYSLLRFSGICNCNLRWNLSKNLFLIKENKPRCNKQVSIYNESDKKISIFLPVECWKCRRMNPSGPETWICRAEMNQFLQVSHLPIPYVWPVKENNWKLKLSFSVDHGFSRMGYISYFTFALPPFPYSWSIQYNASVSESLKRLKLVVQAVWILSEIIPVLKATCAGQSRLSFEPAENLHVPK